MKKKTAKLLSVILALMLIVCTMPNMALTSFAAVYSGTCGDNLTWQYNTSTYTLTISGTGAMSSYSITFDWITTAPWGSYYNTMKTVIINSGVTSIGMDAFYNCTELTSITLPYSVTSIGSSAFYGCTSLNKVNISDIAAWCNISFIGFDSNPLYHAHNLYLNDELVTDLVIPDGVTSLGNYAFSGCTGITSVTIPDSVLTIGGTAFPQSTVIYGTPSTAAEIFANSNGNKFIALPDYIKVFYIEKTDYSIGSEMEPNSVIIAVYFADGEVKLYYKNFTVSGFDTSTPGKKTVTVSYYGKEATFTINVSRASADDLTTIVDMVLGKGKADEKYDLNGDGNVNILDLIKMKKQIANM